MSVYLATIDSDVKDDSVGIAIPPRPELLANIAKVFPNTGKVAALIAEDPALKQGVLKIVNSNYLGVPHPVDKLEQAIVLLGLDAVMNVVNAVMLRDSLSIDGDPKLQKYWQNTKATAAAAGMLANELTDVKPDDAYLLGLFRDCAIPLIYQKFPRYFSILEQGYRDHAARIVAIEDKQLNANHAVVGHLIARAWHLPKPIVQAINDHHSHRRMIFQGGNLAECYVDKLCATLKLAEHVTRTPLTLTNTVRDHEWEIYKKPVLQLIAKSPQEILDVVSAIMVTLKETEDLL
jgi:HD-like signal output (HDOD) protein